MRSKPKAVIISDIHFTPNTLELASKSLVLAQNKALELGVPLIIAGDTLDTKDIMRGQCVNRIIDLVEAKEGLSHYFLVGNHDLLNEKGVDHSLRFLSARNNSFVICSPVCVDGLCFIPYQTNQETFVTLVRDAGKFIVLCHQGLQGANLGHYVQDKTSVTQEQMAGRRIISGHYHARQDIPLPNDGLWSYVGNPYTLSFGEAKDPEKGFQVLMEDGTLEFVPTKLRKHVIVEHNISTRELSLPNVAHNDLIWLKLSGTSVELAQVDKQRLGKLYFGSSNFKIDKIPTDSTPEILPTKSLTKLEILDQLIDSASESIENKEKLKSLAKELLDE